VGQAFDILKRGRAKLICDFTTRFKALAAGIDSDRILFMVSGIRLEIEGLFVKALPAHHISFSQIGESAFISSQPLSYLITTPGGVRIFFGGDTSISMDHKLFGELYKPHVAVLGVGGVDVLGQSMTELYPDEAALVAKWLGVKVAFPMHYRFDEGSAFAKELKKRTSKTKAVLLKPGESYRFALAGASTVSLRRRVAKRD
jgi:L-ascorbate metabolism protein UlaG (beta-lactamase superfamily)